VSQLERTRAALEAARFHDVRTLEIIERAWTVHEGGARPSHEMLGHTAFLTFARKG
jgi:tRNA (adenine57-N1/adenine58-N1)-methyltransferase